MTPVVQGRGLEVECDSAEFYFNAFDARYKSDPDSAAYFIDIAIARAEGCNDGERQVRYLLEKAFLISEGEKSETYSQVSNVALALALAHGDSLTLARTYRKFGTLHNEFSKFDSAIYMYNNALKYISPGRDSLELIKVLTRRGITYDSQGVYDKAISDYLKALLICEDLNFYEEISGLYNNIAIVYKKQDDLPAAINYYHKARELAMELENEESMAICNVNIGLLEKDLGNYAISDSLFHSSLAYFDKSYFDYGIALVLHNLGELKRKEGNNQEALDYYQRSQKYASARSFKQIEANNSFSMARLYVDERKNSLALRHAHHSLHLATELNMKQEQSEANKILSEIYEISGRPGLALQYYKAYHQQEDSLYNEKKSAIINQLKTIYESTQKDAEISLLKKEQALQETELAASIKQRRFLVILSIALIVIFGLLAFMYTKTRRYNERLKWKREEISKQKLKIEAKQQELILKNKDLVKLSQEKDDLINIVAHDLRSPLNQVKGLLSILKMEVNADKKPETQLYFNNIDLAIDTLRGRINKILDVELINADKMSLKLEQVNPGIVLENVQSIFKGQAASKGIKINNLCNGFDKTMKADYNFTIQIMENLVSNAIKFSKSGEDITLKISETSGHIRLHVKDQGPGITKDDRARLFKKYSRLSAKPTANEKSIGLGLAIVKKYVESMGGEVWCESNIGKGSEFIVQFAKA
ncbi:MAG: tetratricopeptide repeat protein [Cyclobacteriaceae bacterium]|nr:tetratricopeptide repeat protein [Cyclobacteriaceae bacterium]